MRIKTLFNHVFHLKSFVYGKTTFQTIEGHEALVVDLIPRQNGVARCSDCGQRAPVYDTAPHPRLFEYVPLWIFQVYFRYRMRRVNCPRCKIKVEAVEWAQGKEHQTRPYQLFLARWARRLSWSEVAQIFRTNWENVYRAVKAVVEYGLAHRTVAGVQAIGVDEIQYGKGQKYLTVVYQLDEGCRRLLYVAQNRTVKSLLGCFRWFGRAWAAGLRYVCSDMWKPYLKVLAKKAPQALHILDRFHIVEHLNKALDEIRAGEARRLVREGYENVLKHLRFCYLKRRENTTPAQALKLKEVLQYDLKSNRAYLLKESFQLFWEYTSPYWAAWFLKKWCARAMRSRLEPIKKFVRMVRRHEGLLMNWFKARKAFSNAVSEGFNRKINLITRKSYGFRDYEVLKIALFHGLGELPEPEITHGFC